MLNIYKYVVYVFIYDNVLFRFLSNSNITVIIESHNTTHLQKTSTTVLVHKIFI